MQRIMIGTPYVDASATTGSAATVAGQGRYWRVEIMVDDGITPENHPDVSAVIAAAKQMIECEYGTPGIVMETRRV